jgi:hypothetical protein
LKGDPVPPEDHLAIHCQPSHLIERDEAGEPRGVSPDVFRVDEEGISSNWIEFEKGDGFEAQFSKACLLLTSGRTVRASHRAGVIVVAEIFAIGAAAKRELTAVHDPLEQPPNPGHALITGLRPGDATLLHELSVLVELRQFAEEAIPKAAEAERRRGPPAEHS